MKTKREELQKFIHELTDKKLINSETATFLLGFIDSDFCNSAQDEAPSVHDNEPTQEVCHITEVRQAIADYMRSEGCSCCRDIDAHKEHEERLGELLKVEPYSDGSGYDFSKYQSK